MFTAFSVDTWRSDLAEQKCLHQEQLRTRLRRLRRRVRHAASVQRERALPYRLLAGRFALDSPHQLTSAHARPKRDAPHEETRGLASRAFGDGDIRATETMVVCLEILVCAAGSSKVDAFTAHASERVRMKSKRREKIFPTIRPTSKCVSLDATQLFFETSFRRFRRTRLEGRVSFPRGASAWSLVARQGGTKALPCVPGEDETVCCKRGLKQHNRLASDSAGALYRDFDAS
jgi:hypothetical protein